MLLRDEIFTTEARRTQRGNSEFEDRISDLFPLRVLRASVVIYDSNPLYQPCRVGGVGFAGLHRVQQAAADALGFGDFIA